MSVAMLLRHHPSKAEASCQFHQQVCKPQSIPTGMHLMETLIFQYLMKNCPGAQNDSNRLINHWPYKHCKWLPSDFYTWYDDEIEDLIRY